MTGGFELHPSELAKGATSLRNLGSKVVAGTGKLTEEHQTLASSMSEDESGVGGAIRNVLTKTEQAFGEVGQQIGRVAEGAGGRIESEGATAEATEARITRSFTEIHTQTPTTRAHDVQGGGTTEQSSAGSTYRSPRTPAPAAGGGASGGGAGGGPTTPSGARFEEPEEPADPSIGAAARPPLTGKPPSAGARYSPDFVEHPNLSPGRPYGTDTPPLSPYGMPTDKKRGAQVERIDEGRVTRGDDGLIKTVDGKPVAQYVDEAARRQALIARNPEQAWRTAQGDTEGTLRRPRDMSGKEPVCSSVGIDLRTGSVAVGINGNQNAVVPVQNLHPLLQHNYQNLRAWQHPIQGTDVTLDGKAHISAPNQHAEVKAVNELLWQRQAQAEAEHGAGYQLPGSVLGELRVDPRWTQGERAGDPVPCCANCSTIIDGVPSYSGRYDYDAKDSRYPATPPPGHQD